MVKATPLPRRFNGKPLSHWQRLAKEIVVESLLRAAYNFGGRPGSSLPGEIASKRLRELAEAEDPELVRKVLDERKRCLRGTAAAFADITGRPLRDTPRRAAKAKRRGH